MTESRPVGRLEFWQILLVAALLCIQFMLAVAATRQKCATFHEVNNLTAGYSAWRHNDYRLGGTLPQRLAALPLLSMQPAFPDDSSCWQRADLWQTGQRFFYASGNDPDTLLLLGRVMIGLLTAGLGVLVFWYARRLFGILGGFLSLTLYVICPTLLASSALITADVPAALLFLASLPAMWRLLHEVAAGSIIVCGMLLGGLFLTDCSAALVVPVAGTLLLLRLLTGGALEVRCFVRRTVFGRLRLAAVLTVVFLVQAVIVWGLIWLNYGCRYEAFNQATAEQFLEFPTDTTAPWVLWVRDLRLLPEGFLHWHAESQRTAFEHTTFLNGRWSDSGFVEFFPYCFLVKTPLGIMTALLLGWEALCWRITGRSLYAIVPLLAFLVVFWATALTCFVNIGQTQLVPIYPALYVLAGAGAGYWERWFGRPRDASRTLPLTMSIFSGLLLAASVVWAALDSLRAWPNCLTYFNQFTGGPREGYRHLVDSSLDWGQDLPGLKRWLDRQKFNKDPVFVIYFGAGDLEAYGIANALPGVSARPALYVPTIGLLGSPLGQGPLLAGTSRVTGEFPELPFKVGELKPGIYCVSATYLQGVHKGPAFRGAWGEEQERLYQKGMEFRWQYDHRVSNEGRDGLSLFAKDGGPERLMRTYQELQLARLINYLREKRTPNNDVNDTILIYLVEEKDLAEALQPWLFPE